MKRFIGLFSVVLIAFAANMFAAEVKCGLKVGLNLSDITMKAEGVKVDLSGRTGVALGGFVDIGFHDVVSFQPEFLYSMKGGKQEETGVGKLDIRLHYLEIPLLLKIGVPIEDSSVKPYLLAGPALAFKLSESIKLGGVDAPEDMAKSFDAGAVFGGGVEFGRVTVGVRYDLGFMDIAEKELEEEGVEIKNRAISVLLGVKF